MAVDNFHVALIVHGGFSLLDHVSEDQARILIAPRLLLQHLAFGLHGLVLGELGLDPGLLGLFSCLLIFNLLMCASPLVICLD